MSTIEPRYNSTTSWSYFDELNKAVEEAISRVKPEHYRNYFKHAYEYKDLETPFIQKKSTRFKKSKRYKKE